MWACGSSKNLVGHTPKTGCSVFRVGAELHQAQETKETHCHESQVTTIASASAIAIYIG